RPSSAAFKKTICSLTRAPCCPNRTRRWWPRRGRFLGSRGRTGWGPAAAEAGCEPGLLPTCPLPTPLLKRELDADRLRQTGRIAPDGQATTRNGAAGCDPAAGDGDPGGAAGPACIAPDRGPRV